MIKNCETLTLIIIIISYEIFPLLWEARSNLWNKFTLGKVSQCFSDVNWNLNFSSKTEK